MALRRCRTAFAVAAGVPSYDVQILPSSTANRRRRLLTLDLNAQACFPGISCAQTLTWLASQEVNLSPLHRNVIILHAAHVPLRTLGWYPLPAVQPLELCSEAPRSGVQIALTTAASIAAAPTLVASLKSDPALVLASDASLYAAYGPVTVTSLATSSSLTPSPPPPPPAGAPGSCACCLPLHHYFALAVVTAECMI